MLQNANSNIEIDEDIAEEPFCDVSSGSIGSYISEIVPVSYNSSFYCVEYFFFLILLVAGTTLYLFSFPGPYGNH
jgi:hypothetical protein